MAHRFRASYEFGDYKRGDEVPAEKVTEHDLQFNRVVRYNYSAPPPQPIEDTPLPQLVAEHIDVTSAIDELGD